MMLYADRHMAVHAMTNLWRDLYVGPNQTIRDVLACIDKGKQKLALVVDENERLVGIISDGDIRRALLRGVTLDEPAKAVMNSRPTVGTLSSSIEDVRRLMRTERLPLVPIVDQQFNIVGIEFSNEADEGAGYDNLVVLMAGGRGIRLLPLTENTPKPLLRIGDRPILEIIIRQFAALGFRRFLISINYLGNMIREHCRDGSHFGVSIDYIEEKSSLGTAVALGLMADRPARPFIVINGDLLTKLNFGWLVEYHEQMAAEATLAVREYDMQVPFGVVTTSNGLVTAIDEKPVHSFFINGGVYVLNPGVLDLIEPNVALDMPELLERIIAAGRRTTRSTQRRQRRKLAQRVITKRWWRRSKRITAR